MVQQQIRTLLEKQLPVAVPFTVEQPNQAGHGDYASNAALVAAKKEGRNPRDVAMELKKKLESEDLFSSVEVAGPGFLNFRVAPAAWHEVLSEILKQAKQYGTFPKIGRSVQVEFISANPTGPLTLGNGRGGFGGDVLANVLTRAGNRVEREYYINDAGNQIVALGKTLKGEEVLYAGEYIDDLKKKIDTAERLETVGELAVSQLLAEIQQTVGKMNIHFDRWFSERKELHETEEVDRVLKDLTRLGETYEKDGALWLKTSNYGDDKDRVIQKTDGTFTYVMPDIAYHVHKFANRKFDHVINIWGADHHSDVKRLQIGVELARKTEKFQGELTILITQLVRLVRDGQEVKMSKRAGTYVALDELLEEVEVDVARFFFLMRGFDTHMDFDLDLAKEQSQKNPVFYLKYAFARIAGILRQGEVAAQADLSKLEHPAELTLIKELAEFPDLIERTATDYQIQRVPHYALKLADSFHQFYEQCRVITDDKELTQARLKLVEATRTVLQNVGDTLGITMPERM